VKHGKLQQFIEGYERQVPVLEGYGWKLVGGWTNIFGRVYTSSTCGKFPAPTPFSKPREMARHPRRSGLRAITAKWSKKKWPS